MGRWRSWIWPGILIVAIVSALAVFLSDDVIRADLSDRSVSGLSERGADWANITFEGRDATLTGDAPTPAAQTEAAEFVRGLHGVRVVENRTDLIPLRDPYVFKATKGEDALTLSGSAPNSGARDELVKRASALFPDATIDNRMDLARGADASFDTHAAFALAQLAQLVSGEVVLTGSQLSVSGVTGDRTAYDSAMSALDTALPNGLSLAQRDVSPPVEQPYLWAVEKTDDGVSLSGFAPDDASRAALRAQVEQLHPGTTVVDETLLASGAPDGHSSHAEFALDQLNRLDIGTMKLSDGALTVSGKASSSQDYEHLLDLADTALPPGLTVAQIEMMPPRATPYTWSLRREGSALRFSGHVPDRAMKDGIPSIAERLLPGIELSTDIEYAAGAPAEYGEALAFAMRLLNRFDTGRIDFTGKMVTVEGRAKTSDDYEAARAAIQSGFPGAHNIGSADVSPPVADVFGWSVDYDGSRVALTGHVSDKETRQKLLKQVGEVLPDAVIVDQMAYAAGGPANFAERSADAIGLLGRMARGRVGLGSDGLSIDGKAATVSDAKALQEAVAALGDDAQSLGVVEIEPPEASGDYVLRLQKTRTTIFYEGSVPSAAFRQRIEKLLKTTFPDRSISGALAVETGAPDGFEIMLDDAVDLLSKIATGSATIRNGKLAIAGQASNVLAHAALSERLQQQVQNYEWGNHDLEPVRISPYVWRLSILDRVLSLGGFVPSEEARRRILQMRNNEAVNDTQRVASGAPEGFEGVVSSVLKAAAGLRMVDANLTGERLAFSGIAGSEDAARRVEASLRDMLPPNFTLRATIAHPVEAAAVTPIEIYRAKPEVPSSESEAEFDSNAKTEKAQPVENDQLAKTDPEATSNEEPLTEQGTVPNGTETPSADDAPKPIPDEGPVVALGGDVEIDDRVEKACDVDFNAILEGQTILFSTARAVIQPQSFDLLDRISDGLKKCDGSLIEVGGHTDRRGADSYNLDLSEARARAVTNYLVSSGVPADQLIAKGYGETRPIAAEEDPDGESLNRRIEFKVVATR